MIIKTKRFSSELEAVRRSLEAWRRTRQHRDRIPEPLWAAMTRLAGTYGISPVSAALRVEYYALRDRVAQFQKGATAAPSNPPAFIEFKTLPTSRPTGFSVELEDGSGSKMTLRLDPGSSVDAFALVQAFWRRTT